MRILIATLVALAASLGISAYAQMPLPFGPEPNLSKRPQCTRDYVQSVRRLGDALEKLRTAGPEAVGQVCTMIEMGSTLFGGKLPDALRQELRNLLGHDVDLERLKTQCRAGQDGIARELTDGLARLKAELARCDDTI
jgi:hypothetical protein